MSSNTKYIESLTTEQESLIEPWRDRAIATGLATYDRAEESPEIAELVARTYEVGGCKAPARILLVDSPKALALASTLANRPGAEIEELEKCLEAGSSNSLSTTRLQEELRERGLTVNQLNGVAYGQHDMSWISYYQYFRHVVGAHTETNLDPLATLSARIGWWIPYENLCLISRRPTELHLEATPRRPGEPRRLHRMDGPAIQWRDGERLYFIAGVPMPADVMEIPREEIDPRRFFSEKNAEVRMALGMLIGIDRLLSQLPTTVVDYKELGDVPYILRDLQNRTEGVPEWALDGSGKINTKARAYELIDVQLTPQITGRYLRMGNASENKVHIEGVPPEITTVDEANAWRAGWTVEEVAGIEALT